MRQVDVTAENNVPTDPPPDNATATKAPTSISYAPMALSRFPSIPLVVSPSHLPPPTNPSINDIISALNAADVHLPDPPSLDDILDALNVLGVPSPTDLELTSIMNALNAGGVTTPN
ncbi:hypothetical protein EK21DRAFT_114687 [Setomelanomma holmii]|uniref:Uncharacterized protein n=1 Tax=Setomelanomma holmii TaxID=210430 RepID=A0A9P4LJW4_9PLEO|nr:hypothetical protein EK21DRAFT_114687 [Setomelanomma holmii]